MMRIHMLKKLCWSLAIAAVLMAATAGAAAAAPAFQILKLIPDYVTPGLGMQVFVAVENTGDAPLSGNLTVRYTFPAGVSPADPQQFRVGFPDPACSTVGQVDECVIDATGLPPGGELRFKTVTTVDPSASGTLVGSIEVSGGGAPDDVTMPWTMSAAPFGPFAFKAFDVGMTDGARVPATQAGADPAELTTNVEFPSHAAVNLGLPSPSFFVTAPAESFKDVVVHVPPGLVGNPTATPVRCAPSQLTTPIPVTTVPQCPVESQIGVARLLGGDIVPIYNIEPPIGSPAEFGFYYQSIVVTLLAKLRPSDNGIDIVTKDSPSSIPIPNFRVTLWGVPGDPSHDPLRGGLCLFEAEGYFGNNGTSCPLNDPVREAFLRMPTSCTGNPLTWGIDVTTYQHPDTSISDSTTTPGVSGCPDVPFGPSFALTPTTGTAHAPTGLDATLRVPQDNGPDGVAQADLRTATVTLPPGMTLNPSSADGLQACTDDQLNLGRDGAASCPNASKIGSVTLTSPLLDHPLSGSIFLRTQASDDPASGQMFRIATEIRSDDDGIDIKLPASVSIDPGTGTVTTTFDNLPQLPFSTFLLHFKDGPRAPLVTPSTCGDNAINVSLTSWSGTTVGPAAGFATSGCGGATFAPAFRAGVVNPVAGKSSPFNVRFTRTDGDQEFKGVTVYTPTGLLGRIKNAEQCASAAADTGNCPSGSQLGTSTVGAGVGTDPFYVTNGKVFLTGPYKGAPYGLAIAVHALAGPFDLGMVIVRAAIHVDPRTAALSVTSDPFPTIVKGVPLSIRDVRLSIDKPNFMVNPTSCAAKQVAATFTSLEGANTGASSRFQVGECGNLKFAPTITLTVGSKHHTGVGGSTPLTTTLTQGPGQANLKAVKVTLPTTIDALLPVVNRACTLAQYQAGHCSGARAGSAVAVSPLLPHPLKGGAFFVRHPGRPLPDLMVALRGDVSLDLVGRITIPGGTHLAANFDTIPDAPVSSFSLSLVSGSNGPVGVVKNLCSKSARTATASIGMRAQNGALIQRHQRLRIRGC